jgi:hypothetical protein
MSSPKHLNPLCVNIFFSSLLDVRRKAYVLSKILFSQATFTKDLSSSGQCFRNAPLRPGVLSSLVAQKYSLGVFESYAQ